MLSDKASFLIQKVDHSNYALLGDLREARDQVFCLFVPTGHQVPHHDKVSLRQVLRLLKHFRAVPNPQTTITLAAKSEFTSESRLSTHSIRTHWTTQCSRQSTCANRCPAHFPSRSSRSMRLHSPVSRRTAWWSSWPQRCSGVWPP